MDTSNTTGPIRRFVHDPSPAAAAGPYLPLGDGDEDDSRLNQLGYKQELRRSLSALSSFATTFNIVSVITGITTLYEMGLNFGGPVTMVYGWPVVGCMTLLVGLSMAEICSAYPTSGGLYFWSAKLCGNNWGPFAAWLTGCLSNSYVSLGLGFVSPQLRKVSNRRQSPYCLGLYHCRPHTYNVSFPTLESGPPARSCLSTRPPPRPLQPPTHSHKDQVSAHNHPPASSHCERCHYAAPTSTATWARL
ncbi:Amino-acid permease BAT1 homolog [Linum grandiflorum]